jgi:hypothetical protein
MFFWMSGLAMLRLRSMLLLWRRMLLLIHMLLLRL